MKSSKALVVCFFVIICQLFANIPAYSQETEPVVRNIKQGEEAPFDGVIMNYPAADKVMTEHERIVERCKIDMEEQEEILKEECENEKNLCNIELKLEIDKNNEIIQIKDEHIKYLEDLNTEQEDWSELYFIGGLVGGVLITTIVVVVVD